MLFVVGINTALRISDLLQLQVNHFVDEDGYVKKRFLIKEKKSGKRHEIVINQSIQEAMAEYLHAYPHISKDLESFLFFNPNTNQAIKRGQAWKLITAICKEAGLRGNYGTHSLRKTRGYHARMIEVDLALIMHKLNHNSIAYTKRYLGITDDELEEVVRKLNL